MRLKTLIAAAACAGIAAGAAAAPAGAADYKSCTYRDRMFHCVGASGGSIVVKCPVRYDVVPASAQAAADVNGDGLVCEDAGATFADDAPLGSLGL